MPPVGGDPLLWRVSADKKGRDGGVSSNTAHAQADVTLSHANAPVVSRELSEGLATCSQDQHLGLELGARHVDVLECAVLRRTH